MTRPIAIIGRSAPVVVGLGGNLGEPPRAFRWAVDSLAERAAVHAVSRLYRSVAWGPPQPDYLNAAVLLEFTDSLEDLLALLQELEAKAGRKRGIRWGPRTLDLDILWAGERVLSTSTLTVPHPELTHRSFALRPLLDVVPWALDPATQSKYAHLETAGEHPDCECVEGPNWWAADNEN